MNISPWAAVAVILPAFNLGVLVGAWWAGMEREEGKR